MNVWQWNLLQKLKPTKGELAFAAMIGALVALYLVATAAFATDTEVTPTTQYQQQDQNQFQVQNNQQTSEQANAQTQSLNVEDRRQAPASFAPPIASTAPCYYGVGGALSIPVGSIGGGKAIKDPECELREQIRLGYGIGLVVEARQLWCASAGKDVKGCGALTAPPAPSPEAKPTVVVLTGESCASNSERVDRVLEKCVGK